MFGISSIFSAISGLFGTNLIGKIFGNKEAREQAVHEEQTDVLDEFASENVVRPNRTGWDSLIDGLNRLPRPLGFSLTLAVMIWPIYDPASFAIAVTSWAIIPQWMVQMIMGVWALYFGGRIISKDLNLSGPTAATINEMLQHQRDIKAQFAAQATPPVVVKEAGVVQPSTAGVKSATDSQYQKDMASPKPLPLPSIVKWNELHNPNYKP